MALGFASSGKERVSTKDLNSSFQSTAELSFLIFLICMIIAGTAYLNYFAQDISNVFEIASFAVHHVIDGFTIAQWFVHMFCLPVLWHSFAAAFRILSFTSTLGSDLLCSWPLCSDVLDVRGCLSLFLPALSSPFACLFCMFFCILGPAPWHLANTVFSHRIIVAAGRVEGRRYRLVRAWRRSRVSRPNTMVRRFRSFVTRLMLFFFVVMLLTCTRLLSVGDFQWLPKRTYADALVRPF